MLLPSISQFHKRRGPSKGNRLPPAPPALMLISAAYDAGDPSMLTLGFSRAISLAGLIGSAITVNDPVDTGTLWDATGWITVINPATVQFEMTAVASGRSQRREVSVVSRF